MKTFSLCQQNRFIMHCHYFHIEVKRGNIIKVLNLTNIFALQSLAQKTMKDFTRRAVNGKNCLI